jgi:hypothetical protein
MPLRPHAEDKNLNMLHLDVIESQTCQCNTKQKKKKYIKIISNKMLPVAKQLLASNSQRPQDLL